MYSFFLTEIEYIKQRYETKKAEKGLLHQGLTVKNKLYIIFKNIYVAPGIPPTK